MAKKPLGKDKMGIQKVMRMPDYLGDAAGQFSLNAISGLVGQLTYFYTDKVGVAAGAIATALLIVKILDAFTDIIMGYVVDHTKPGKEKYRPWIFRMIIPMAVVMVLMFTVPANVSSPLQIAYMFITNFLFTAVIYTIICVPYQAIMVVRTNSQEERAKMGTWRAAAGYVSGMIIAVMIIPITNMLGGDQKAWVMFSAGLAVVSAILLFVTYKTSKEYVAVEGQEAEAPAAEEEESLPFGETLKCLFHNKYWVMALILAVCSNIFYGLSNSSGTYYCKWIYGNDNLVGILGGVGLIPTVIGFAVTPILIKTLGVTKSLRVSFVIGIVGNVLRIINPYNFVYNAVLGCFSTFANIPMMCLLGTVTAMSIDYNEFKFGKRMVGSSQAAASFGSKVGNGVGASMIGWCLAIAAYDATATVLTPAVKQAIFTFNIYAPLAMFVIMFIVAMKFDLEKKLPEIQAELEKKKSKN
ncbi:MAG TPA: glycoside-pentoside-hexuronide (GPH):cation symporter [Candidatus Mediterraneibacter excrementigallinarum]|nr:glycoside-pentoside-hexuronide (GPH):cation symporter [Candidatus Mediterraneibacter excrementigallinarum]